jgi:hypothetical protein
MLPWSVSSTIGPGPLLIVCLGVVLPLYLLSILAWLLALLMLMVLVALCLLGLAVPISLLLVSSLRLFPSSLNMPAHLIVRPRQSDARLLFHRLGITHSLVKGISRLSPRLYASCGGTRYPHGTWHSSSGSPTPIVGSFVCKCSCTCI